MTTYETEKSLEIHRRVVSDLRESQRSDREEIKRLRAHVANLEAELNRVDADYAAALSLIIGRRAVVIAAAELERLRATDAVHLEVEGNGDGGIIIRAVRGV